MQTVIQSLDNKWRAHLTDTPEGVSVDLYRLIPANEVWTLTQRGLIDMPFHVVCDHVYKVVNAKE